VLELAHPLADEAGATMVKNRIVTIDFWTYENIMCYLRVQLCENCKNTVNELIVPCREVRRMRSITHPLEPYPQAFSYTREMMESIMSTKVHDVNTVYVTRSLCQRCYGIVHPVGSLKPYSDYRAEMDAWTSKCK